MKKTTKPAEAKPGHARFFPVGDLKHPPENDLVYRPIDPTDPEIVDLARSLQAHGVLQPLTVTLDNYVLNGNRRLTAARVAGLAEVPCTVEPITHDHPRFLPLLREHNRQRVKSPDELAREEVITASDACARRTLAQYREARARPAAERIEIEGQSRRSKISAAKMPMLRAALAVMNDRREFWPLTVRQVHYALLNDPPLRHASKPHSRYANNHPSYNDLTDLLLRGRLEGHVPWDAIDDPTRPIETWNVHQGVATYVRDELNDFLLTYWRDLQQGQPRHIEVVGEKNTIAGIIRPVCADYCVPMTLGRGYSSGSPRHKMAQRFGKSGRARLTLLVLSDLDPEGEDIANNFALSLRDEFHLGDRVDLVKVALTGPQVEAEGLPRMAIAKEGSSRAKKYIAKHGEGVYELEALRPARLQQLLREAVESVMDVAEFHRQQGAEREDDECIQRLRRKVMGSIGPAVSGA